MSGIFKTYSYFILLHHFIFVFSQERLNSGYSRALGELTIFPLLWYDEQKIVFLALLLILLLSL